MLGIQSISHTWFQSVSFVQSGTLLSAWSSPENHFIMSLCRENSHSRCRINFLRTRTESLHWHLVHLLCHSFYIFTREKANVYCWCQLQIAWKALVQNMVRVSALTNFVTEKLYCWWQFRMNNVLFPNEWHNKIQKCKWYM